jgi:hypothetical protein
MVLSPAPVVVPVAAPAAFTHPRRAPGAGADHGKLNKLFSNPSFLWSTDVRNKQLVPLYLSHVKAGISRHDACSLGIVLAWPFQAIRRGIPALIWRGLVGPNT